MLSRLDLALRNLAKGCCILFGIIAAFGAILTGAAPNTRGKITALEILLATGAVLIPAFVLASEPDRWAKRVPGNPAVGKLLVRIPPYLVIACLLSFWIYSHNHGGVLP